MFYNKYIYIIKLHNGIQFRTKTYIIYIVYHDIQNTSKYFNLENFYKSFLSMQKRPFFSDVGPLSQLIPTLRDFTGQIQSNLQTFQTETIRGEADIEKTFFKKYLFQEILVLRLAPRPPLLCPAGALLRHQN